MEDSLAALQYYLPRAHFRETWPNYLKNDEQASTNTLEKVTDPETPPEIIITDEFENEIKCARARRLLEKFQERITEKYVSLYSEIEEIVNDLTGEDSAKILKTFQNAQDKLGKIREKFEKEVDDALDSLDSSLLTFEDDLEYLSDKRARQIR